MVGGTDTIPADAVVTTAIESGSRILAHDQFVAIGMELTARAGADSIVVTRAAPSTLTSSPHGAADTGSGPAHVLAPSLIAIEFDDGTLGWLDPATVPTVVEPSAAFSSSSTPDEVALVARWPFTFQASGLYAIVGNTASPDDFELILYSDPLGTPSPIKTADYDASVHGTAAAALQVTRPFATSDVTIAKDTDYGIALRPTTVNSLSYQRLNLGSGNGNLRKATMLGTNWSLYSRTDQTGAFGSQDTTILPVFGVWAIGFDDGAGGGVFISKTESHGLWPKNTVTNPTRRVVGNASSAPDARPTT